VLPLLFAAAALAGAAETSLFELLFVLGPMLVAAFVVVTDRPATALIFAAVATLLGTATIARLPLMRRRHQEHDGSPARGSGPLRSGGFPALLVCVTALGVAFGAAGGIWFGTRRPAMALPRRFARWRGCRPARSGDPPPGA
jgi:hypothetical protein